MRNLEDYENRIDHLDSEGTINHNLYLDLKEKVGNRIGRKYEHQQFLDDERALDIQEEYHNTIVDDYNNDVVVYANLLDALKYGLD